jgi:transcriptional regulator with XRE-family HTH domain
MLSNGVAMEGYKLRAIRKALRMTQVEFAEAMGVTSTFVGMMERGDKPIERRTELAALYLELIGREAR